MGSDFSVVIPVPEGGPDQVCVSFALIRRQRVAVPCSIREGPKVLSLLLYVLVDDLGRHLHVRSGAYESLICFVIDIEIVVVVIIRCPAVDA